jgi:hypothetical protein
MATDFYKRRLITSTPKNNSRTRSWIPYVYVSWHDEKGKFQLHRFPELDAISFRTEQEADSYGISIGRRWVDTDVFRTL